MDIPLKDTHQAQEPVHHPQPKPVFLPSELPTLATKETAKLRDRYPSLEHLEAGNVASWLIERQDQLLCKAQRGRTEMNVAKLVTMAGTAIGAVCYATSPLAPIGALCAGVGYVWTLGQDINDSHQFAPIPFVRGDFFAFLSAMGDSEAREAWFEEQNELTDLILHLKLYERYEYVMLREFGSHLSAYLDQVETGKRFYAYRWLLDRYIDYKGALPDEQSLQQHLASVAHDPRINYETVGALKAQQSALVLNPQQSSSIPFPTPPTVALSQSPIQQTTSVPASAYVTGSDRNSTGEQNPVAGFGTAENSTEMPDISPRERESVPPLIKIPVPISPMPSPTASHQKSSSTPRAVIDRAALLTLPLEQRAEQVIDLLKQGGFDLARCVERQISVICGNQRGGKGTLMAILAVLSRALSPELKVHYYTAGTDIYPFACDRLVCAHTFFNEDEPDKAVALSLYHYLREMDKASVGAYTDRIIVIDEAVALSDYLEAEQKQWIIRFLLSRASKKGAQIFVVLHGHNLTSWVGTGNTSGLSSTFKADVTFIGCEATSKKVGALRSIAVATGRYFLADPESFATPVKGGDIGMIPAWLKTETNPFTEQPDPARSLLTYFPELLDNTGTEPPIVGSPEEFTADSLSTKEREELHQAMTKVESVDTSPQLPSQTPGALSVYSRSRW